MRILVDTQCWLWMLSAPERLSRSAQRTLASDEHELFLSAASAWEIAIKHGLEKLQLPSPPDEFVPSRLRVTGVRALPVSVEHALHVAQLPRHHRDPFDRLLVAQARIEDLSLMTADRQLRAYDVHIIWAGRR